MGQLEFEAARVAAAFRLAEWKIERFSNFSDVVGAIENLPFWARIDHKSTQWELIELGKEGDGCKLFAEDDWDEDEQRFYWAFYPVPEFHELMARGLYRLGFEDEAILAQLNHLFTAHEQLELRLSMPREFWPQKWLDELR